MKLRGAWAGAALVFLLLPLAGCRREAPSSPVQQPTANADDPGRTAASESPALESTSDLSAAVVLVVGTRQSSDGPAVVPRSGFSIGERVTFVLRGGPGAPSEVELVWRDAGDRELHRARSPLAPGQSVEPSFTPPGGWSPGAYRLEVLAGGEVVAEQRFEVAELGERSELPGV